MFRAVKRKTPPAKEPLEVTDIKSWLKDEDDDENTIHESNVSAARGKVEALLKRRLITQDWTVYFDAFKPTMLIPLAPVQSVLEIRYRDLSGDWQTLDTSVFEAFVAEEPATISPVWGGAWPGTWPSRGAVEVDVRIGYGDNGSDVPEPILTAIRREAAGYFEHRESVVMSGRPAELPGHDADLLPFEFHY